MKLKIGVMIILFTLKLLANSQLNYEVKMKSDNLVIIGVSQGDFVGSIKEKYYIVKGKEDLEEVAHSHKISIEELIRINNLKDKRDIKPGQILYFYEDYEERMKKNNG